MAKRTVTAPDGRTWVVRRRWAPRLGDHSLWTRFRDRIRGTFRRTGEVANLGDGCVAIDDLVVVLVVIVVVVLAVFVVFPVLIALVDLLIIVLLAALSVVGRVVFRRPWTVEARTSDGRTVHRSQIVGWRASAERRGQLADEIAAGLTPSS